MIKKIIIILIAFVGFAMQSSLITAFAETEVSEEDIQKAEQAYKTGISLTRTKAYDNAIKAFQQAFQYNPNMTDALYNIASIYVAQQKYDEAYNTYVKIIAINPHDYDSILQAAKISYNRKNYALAMKYLKYIPDDYEYYYIVQQLYKDAKEMFDQQVTKIERSKVSTANVNKKVLIDKFNSPAGMVVDTEGNIYVASYSDNAIIKVSKNKEKSIYVQDSLLDGPVGLAIDKYDNIYVANYDANNILKISRGGSVSVFMDKISSPYFLYIKDDVLFISEQGNDVVVTYNLSSGK